MEFQPEMFVFLPVLLFSLVCHEAAHAYAAFRGGDDTARLAGRISLNPIVHLDPIGTVLIPIIQIFTGFPLIGWAKPVPVDPSRLRSPKWNLIVSLAGIAVNFALVIAAVIVLKICLLAGVLSDIPFSSEEVSVPYLGLVGLQAMIMINLMLALFNLIPIPPLDGSHVLYYFIKVRDSLAFRIFEFLERFGFILLLALFYFGVIRLVLVPIMQAILKFLFTVFQINV